MRGSIGSAIVFAAGQSLAGKGDVCRRLPCEIGTAEDPIAKVSFHVVEFVLDIVVATEILFDVECSRAGRSLFFCARCPVFTSLGGSDVNGGPRPPSDYIYNKNKRKTRLLKAHQATKSGSIGRLPDD